MSDISSADCILKEVTTDLMRCFLYACCNIVSMAFTNPEFAGVRYAHVLELQNMQVPKVEELGSLGHTSGIFFKI